MSGKSSQEPFKASKSGEQFGLRAVRLGLVTMEQIEKALAVQSMLDKSGQHQLIGMILIDLGMLTTTQLLAILRSYEQE